jgi:outer membrane protein
VIALSLALALAAAPGPTPAPAAAPAPTPAPAIRVLTLDEAVRTARERQPQLLVARSSTVASEARGDEARAPLLPQIGASAQVQRTGGPARSFTSTTGTGTGATGRTIGPTEYIAGLSASQLIWDFGATTGRLKAARQSTEAQRASERFTGTQVLLNVRSAFFNARANKDLVGVARDNLTNQDAHLRQIEGFVRLGTRPEIDLAQARTDRANAEVQLIQTENGYATTRAQLNQAMGLDGPADFDVSDETLPAVDGEDATLDALVAEALGHRPDVTAAERTIASNESTASAVRSQYLPSLGVSGNVNEIGTAIDQTSLAWTATATLTWSLFQGGLTRAQAREADANLAGARAQATAVRQQVVVDVEQARLAVRAAKASLGAAGEALTNARERLRLAEGRYQAGVGSVIELGDAQVALTTAAAQRVQAEYNLATSRAQLLRALGREA